MKYFIQIRPNTFAISELLASAIKKHGLNYKMETQDKKQIYILDDSYLDRFQLIQTTSFTHFYIRVSNQKYRINNKFHSFLGSLHQQRLESKKIDTDRQLGRYFTKQADYILRGLTIPNNVKIVEPFAGEGDLVS